jgi:chromosome partitioning protein
MHDSRRVLNRDVLETIHKYFQEKVFETIIRENVSLAEAPAHRKDIFEYNSRSSGATDYLDLTKEILERTKG